MKVFELLWVCSVTSNPILILFYQQSPPTLNSLQLLRIQNKKVFQSILISIIPPKTFSSIAENKPFPAQCSPFPNRPEPQKQVHLEISFIPFLIMNN